MLSKKILATNSSSLGCYPFDKFVYYRHAWSYMLFQIVLKRLTKLLKIVTVTNHLRL